MHKLFIIFISSLLLSGCWFNNPGAWKSSGAVEPVVPTNTPSLAPTQTVEELGTQADTVLSAEMDADFKSIDADLKKLDEDLKGY